MANDWGDDYSGNINATPAALSNGSNSNLMSGLPAGLALLGTITSYNGYQSAAAATVAAGQSQAAAFQFKAAQERINAGQAIAASQAQSAEIARQGSLALSHNMALVAAGGTAGSASSIRLMAAQAGRTSYEQSLALYQGEDQSRTLTMAAEADTMSGESAILNADSQANALKTKATGSLISGASSLFSKYGSSFFSAAA